MKKFFVFLLIVAGCLFLLYKTGNLPVDTIKAQIMSQTPVNNSGTSTTNVQPQTQIVVETQANGLPVGAVKEGKALIEGIKICENGVVSEKYKGTIVDRKTKYKGWDSSIHTWTEYYSKTLGEIVVIDNNKKSGMRNFYKKKGNDYVDFFQVTGDSLKNQTAEESMQKYVAMKGLAKAIDGSK